ncbi:MAG TPA: winged helix-turn-helix domain-containing protein [Candidatus Acidoferrum sp.]|nr:winged helix-turn-helix domain-containing protein [Candidatus Acidoferrum sp.]
MSIPMTASSALNAQARESKSKTISGSRYLCFGGFQLDTQRELLFKDGSKVRLPGKVFQTLVALLEKPGEVVTREALREKLWPQGTFVNYDANVNTTVNKLRLVLGDSPDQPAYIETIPRLGYCFVGSVERKTELGKVGTAAAVDARGAVMASKPALPLPLESTHTAANAGETQAARMFRAQGANFWSSARNRVWAGVVLVCGMLIGMGIVLLAHRGS